MTDFDEIGRMLDIMEERDLAELEIERDGVRIRLRKQPHPAAGVQPAPVSADVPAPPAMSSVKGEEDTIGDGLVFVKSPIVGTFFRSAEPGSEPFVEVGATVKQGQVLCIIEAMKLMNEIDADRDGEIVSVFVENGQPVQYGEKLFAIRPA